MIQIALRRGFSGVIVDSAASRQVLGGASQGWQDKSADLGRAYGVGWVGYFGHSGHQAYWRSPRKCQRIQSSERHRMRLKVASSL